MDLKENLDLLNESVLPFNIKNVCEKVKELIIDHSLHFNNICDYCDYFSELNYIKSPIEQIFYVAYVLYCKIINNKFSFICLQGIQQQNIIVIDDKKYLIDFVIDFQKNEKLKNLKYAIELDGYEYHSNKKQMNYDYERENNLKIKGYNVIRFTGSQIYKEPFTCVDNLLNIIINDIKREVKKYE